MSMSTSLKEILTQALAIGGIRCGHHLTFYRWVPSGSEIGQAKILTVEQFRKHIRDGDGEYFLDLEDVNVGSVGANSYFVSYLGFNFTLRGGMWSVQMYSEEEELPHEVGIEMLEERSHILSEKVLSIIRLLAGLVMSEGS